MFLHKTQDVLTPNDILLKKANDSQAVFLFFSRENYRTLPTTGRRKWPSYWPLALVKGSPFTATLRLTIISFCTRHIFVCLLGRGNLVSHYHTQSPLLNFDGRTPSSKDNAERAMWYRNYIIPEACSRFMLSVRCMPRILQQST